MKNIKKLMAYVMAFATLGCVSVMPLQANANVVTVEINGKEYDTFLLQYDEDGNILVDENGDPILYTYEEAWDIKVGESGLGTDSVTEVLPNENQITLGESPTGIRGDIDYDGDVDAVDLLLLKKYLLQMITW